MLSVEGTGGVSLRSSWGSMTLYVVYNSCTVGGRTEEEGLRAEDENMLYGDRGRVRRGRGRGGGGGGEGEGRGGVIIRKQISWVAIHTHVLF